ncbi:MAG: glycosyltransferase family 4 protein [Oligoflexia bacterium]|nr:glycosyltransferase family 4 protein [Oligoflexia bacterium]
MPLKTNKIIVVASGTPSDWGSCRTISSNLKKAYERLPGSFQVQWVTLPGNLGSDLDTYDQIAPVHDLYLKIKTSQPDQVVFIDHLPHAADLVAGFLAIDDPFVLPPVAIHIYGDFTYYAKKWSKLQNSPRLPTLRIICASDKQKQLIQGFSKEGGCVQSLPFPVNPEEFRFDPVLRKKARERWSMGPDDRVILYSGRLSLQKNVTRLIQEFARIPETAGRTDYLYLAGGYDDIGSKLLSIRTPQGYYFQQINRILSGIPESVARRVRFLGQLEGKELLGAYCGADVFSSLSLYHDEDYGMAVAEAMACGLPSVVTDWGGYASFGCRLVPVTPHEEGILVSSSAYQNHLLPLLAEPLSDEARKSDGERFLKNFSIDCVAARIPGLLAQETSPFRGFNWKLSNLLEIIRKKTPRPTFLAVRDSFHEEAYSPYFTQSPGVLAEAKWNPDTDLINWWTDYLRHANPRSGFEERPESKALKTSLWPFSEEYHAPSQPIFLFDGWDSRLVAEGGRWHARDGLVPLVSFFRNFEPKQFASRLLVHEDFHRWVPPAWQAQVEYYRIESRASETDLSQTKGLFLCGLMTPSFTDFQQIETQLEQLVATLGKERLATMKIELYFPLRHNTAFRNPQFETVLPTLPFLLTKKLGTHIQVLSDSALDSTRSLRGYFYYELNQGLLIKDSAARHLALSRGAIMLEALDTKRARTRGYETIPLSDFHDLVLIKRENLDAGPSIPGELIDQYAHMGDFFFKTSRFNNVWPEWVEGLCKRYQ